MRDKIEHLSLQHDDANKNYSFDFRNMTWLNSTFNNLTLSPGGYVTMFTFDKRYQGFVRPDVGTFLDPQEPDSAPALDDFLHLLMGRNQ